MVSAQEIVRAAYELQGAPYRLWQPGDPVPMWRKDGMGDPPPVWHLQNVGVNGSDLINYALERNGLPPGGGTGTFADYLVNPLDFDPDTPGEPGAVALRPYSGPSFEQQGRLVLYVGTHRILQVLPSTGVTDEFTDQETYSWCTPANLQHCFTIYGFLPGVRY